MSLGFTRNTDGGSKEPQPGLINLCAELRSKPRCHGLARLGRCPAQSGTQLCHGTLQKPRAVGREDPVVRTVVGIVLVRRAKEEE